MKTLTQTEKLKIILGESLHCEIKNIINIKLSENKNIFKIVFDRNLLQNDIINFNSYFNIKHNSSKIKYEMTYNYNQNILDIDLLTEFNIQIDINYAKYKNKILMRLTKHIELIKNTLIEDDVEINNYTFYFIPNHKKYIGFANNNFKDPAAIKIFSSNFNQSNDFYKNVKFYRCTKNDADIMVLRRNYNSKYKSNWQVCLYKTPINQLLINTN